MFKPALAELAIEKLSPISEEMRRLLAEPDYIDRILEEGAVRAKFIADPIIEEVRSIIGLI